MVWRKDFVKILNGLEAITRILLSHENAALRHKWNTSSFKMALQQCGIKNNDLRKYQKKVQDLALWIKYRSSDLPELVKEHISTAVTVFCSQDHSMKVKDVSFHKQNNSKCVDFSLMHCKRNDDPSFNSNETIPKAGDFLHEEVVSDVSLKVLPDTANANSISIEASAGNTLNDSFDSLANVVQEVDGANSKMFSESPTADFLYSSVQSQSNLNRFSNREKENNFFDPHSQKLSERSKERHVPATRIGRLMSYGGLAAGLGAGAVAEVVRRSVGFGKSTNDGNMLWNNPFLTEANIERIVDTLCRVRGAALKLGQMISIQDNSFITPQLQAIFERVRQSADFMPTRQMAKVMSQEFGSDWQSHFRTFEDVPFAAASIGQVHRGVLNDGQEVAVKIQYPGVTRSIDSDINNLVSVLNVWNILPEGMYIENLIRVARRELAWEVDYVREADGAKRFRNLLQSNNFYYVPRVIDHLVTRRVLTTELVGGIPLDQCLHFDQHTRNKLGEAVLRLCLLELFDWRFMQTDPNWSNFLYDVTNDRMVLLDFGASREFSKSFVDQYIKVIRASSMKDKAGVLKESQELGFLTGYETKAMEDAHTDASMVLGEPFGHEGTFDFSTQHITERIQKLVPVMLKHRLSPPPDETYSLHRKMSGVFLLCVKLSSQVDCKVLFDDILNRYKFEEE